MTRPEGEAAHHRALESLYAAAPINRLFESTLEIEAGGLARIRFTLDEHHFHAAGGLGFVVRTLLESGLLHDDVRTAVGPGLSRYAAEARLDGPPTGRRTEAAAAVAVIDGLLLFRQLMGADAADRAARRLAGT